MKSLAIKIVVGVVLVAFGAIATFFAMTAVFTFSPFGSQSQSRDSQVISSISRVDQVVLLSLGIQGIAEKNENSLFFGMDVPGSERTSFLQYSFNAKLGIEGKDVTIRQTGPNAFVVSIPQFIFIGHSNENFRLAAENNGLLSWVTPEISSIEMINNILDSDAEYEYIIRNREVLEDQAKTFYGNIITSIDPSVFVRFEFRR
ncbi:MAG: hypothetical protein IT190_06535 [Microbacteriaceae bacterium]|nr:hypothetical protein [Microbacteriaceae bacterium]